MCKQIATMLVIIIWFVLAMFVWIAVGTGTDKRLLTVKEVALEINVGDTVALQNWMSSNIKYKADKKDSEDWAGSEETLRRGYADCEDYAILATEVLKEWGFVDVFILGVSKVGRNVGHVVCIFRTSKEQPWMYYDFEKLKKGTQLFKDMPQAIATECRYGSKIEYRLANKDIKDVPKSEEVRYGL